MPVRKEYPPPLSGDPAARPPEAAPADGARSAPSRMLWMDLLRGIGIFLVILLHSTTILERFDIVRPEWMSHVNNSFAPFRIPLLIFLSGMLLDASIKKPPERYFAGKFRNIAWPYVIWTCIYAALIGIDHSWYNPKFWIGPTYLWYLFFLLFYYGCAFFLRDFRPIVVSAVLLVASMFMPDDSKYGERLFFLMGFFFLGHAVSTWPLWRQILDDRRVLLLSPVVLVFGGLSAFYGPYRYAAEYSLITFTGIAVLCAVARMIMHTRIAAPFIYIGQNGIVFYVTHYPAIFLTMSTLTALGIQSAAPISAVSMIVGVATGFLLSYLASFLWFVRVFFVGPPLEAWIARRFAALGKA